MMCTFQLWFRVRGFVAASWGLFFLLLLGTAAVIPAGAQPTSYTITITAGAFERVGTVVSFPLPQAMDDGPYYLLDDAGTRLPVQIDAQGTAHTIIDRMAAGTSNTFRLVTGPPSDMRVDVTERSGAVDLSVADRHVLGYQIDPVLPHDSLASVYRRGGYLHPVHTPTGRRVTDDYPPGHPHHHGIWAAWTRTAFEGRTPDFWNMQDSTGAVVPLALDSAWAGPVHGGFRARHRYDDRSATEPRTALRESWDVRVFDTGAHDYHLFDVTITQSTDANPLQLLTYHYGGLAVRGRRAWHGAGNTAFLTSAGKNRQNGNETRARWAYIGGGVEAGQAGVAVLSHPANFRAPQPVRIHPEMPYFCFAPPQLGDFAIRPGAPYVARYRFIVFDGRPDAQELDRRWNDYAYPPGVTVEAE